MKSIQHEFPGSGEVFNLAGQAAPDPWRIEREKWAERERQAQAKAYQEKMQRTLAECPGFCGSDAPASEKGKGVVVVQPGRIAEAMQWLKRRFYCSEDLELSGDDGLRVEIVPRVRKKGVRRSAPSFKVEQFTLAI